MAGMRTLEQNLHILEARIRDLVNRRGDKPGGRRGADLSLPGMGGGDHREEAWRRERHDIHRRIGSLLKELKPFID